MSEYVTPWSSVGYLVFKRTYARQVEGEERTEEWNETVDRVINACRDQLSVGFTDDEEERLRRYMMELKGTVAGRFLWQLGTETVNRLGLPSLQNCAFTVVDHPIRPFTWAFEMLMLGSGVGYNIQREYVYKLPPVREDFVRPSRNDVRDADFIVPDSREGWVRLLHETMANAFSGCGLASHERLPNGFTYSTGLVRGKGAPIKGFGGVASGAEDLVRGIDQIGGVLEERRGKQLRPIDCLDILNIIGSIVVSGNVRRSAQLAIGDSDDIQYLKAKNWSEMDIPNWRAMSNNSVVCNDIKMLPEEFWKTYEGGSEPYGLINLKLTQSCGRLGETQYKDKKARGFNPCLTGDTQLLTSAGYFPIGDLVGKEVDVWNGKEWSDVIPFSTGVNEIVRVSLTDGSHIDCTPYHKFLIIEGFNNDKVERVDAENLAPGMKLQKWDMPVVDVDFMSFDQSKQAYSQGFYSGDGSSGYTYSYLYEPKYMCEEMLTGEVVPDSNEGRKRWKHGHLMDKSFVPVNESLRYKLSWLAGLLDSDGTVTRDKNGNGLQIASVNHEFLTNVRLMLSTMGCRTKIVSGNKEGMRMMPDGHGGLKEYFCQETRRLLIGNQDTFSLMSLGLKCLRLDIHSEPPQRDARQYIRIKSVEWLGVEEETFCVTEKSLNQMTVNGVVTGNCAEQGLENNETCCLAEVFLPRISSYDELLDVVTLLYRINKHSLALPCHLKETEDVVHRNMRMGIGITGYLSATEEQREWLSRCYEELREFDKAYSKQRGFPPSIKLTTMKPSGTLSLKPEGITPGVHPGYSQHMIRRIRIASDHSLVKVCKDHGYPVEYQLNFDGSEDHSTVVVEFPYAFPEGTVLAKDVDAITQLEFVKRVQREWSDNAVSCTVYYKPEELPAIREYLKKNYNKSFKSLSFLLHSEHGFKQAPLEEITKEEYDRRVASSRLITSVESASFVSEDECASGICPIK